MRNLELRSARRRDPRGGIFQDFRRYNFTAADNIAVGRIEARDDRQRIIESAERSLADEAIRKLPEQYDQLLSKRFRTGIDLSGGEWQGRIMKALFERLSPIFTHM